MGNFPLLKKCISRGVRNALSEVDRKEMNDTDLIIEEIIAAVYYELEQITEE